MATTALVNAPCANSDALPLRPAADPAPALADRIPVLAAHLHAVTDELLVLLREFDDRVGWHDGFASCAHWLHSTPTRTTRASGTPAWRTDIALGAAREKVRVAHALATLPRVSATMARGAVSYAKVRALTRVATPENEAALLDFAQAGTAAHVERFVRAWRRVDQCREPRSAVPAASPGCARRWVRRRDGTVRFLRPNGTVLEVAPALPARSRGVAVFARADAIPVWDGSPFDVVHAIDVLYRCGPGASAPGDPRSSSLARRN